MKKAVWSDLKKVFYFLLGLLVIFLVVSYAIKLSKSNDTRTAELLNFRDYDGDGTYDAFDSCACGSIFEKSQQLFDDGISYCVSNFNSKEVCITKNLLDGKTIMKWDDTKNYCYYLNNDCREFIVQEYAKENKK